MPLRSLLSLLLVVTDLALMRTYHEETIASLARSRHSHVRVEGRVMLVRCEADGDWHLRLTDGVSFIVAEIIPLMPMTRVRRGTPCQGQAAAPARVGQRMVVWGIHRFDNEAGHGWAEVHPVEGMSERPKTHVHAVESAGRESGPSAAQP